MLSKEEITEANFTNLALNTLGHGIIPVGRANFGLAKEYSRQMSIAFAEWLCANYWRKEKGWGKEVGDRNTYTTDEVYNLFLEHQAKQL